MNAKHVVALGSAALLCLAGCGDKTSTSKQTKKKEPVKKVAPKTKVVTKKVTPKVAPPKKEIPLKKFNPETIPQTKYTKQRIILPTADNPLTIDGNAYLSEGRAIKLQWMEEPKSFKVYTTFNEKSKVTGTIKLKKEQRLAYGETRLIVTKPRPFTAKKDLDLKPFGPKFHKVDPSKHMGRGEVVPSVKLKKGQTVNLYHFFPSGNCLLGVMDGKKEAFYRASCPDQSEFDCKHVPPDYASAPIKPIASQWWFEVSQGDVKGWFRIDKTMIIPHLKRLDKTSGIFEKKKDPPKPPEGLGTNPNGPKTTQPPAKDAPKKVPVKKPTKN